MNTMVIAEVGSNWRKLDDLLRSAEVIQGMDCYPKLQAFHANHLCSKLRDPKQYKTLQHYQIPSRWYKRLIEAGYFFSVFCPDIIDELQAYEPRFYKISKPDSRDQTLIAKALSTDRPLFVSTDYEIEYAINLHCISQYPAKSAYLDSMKPWHEGISDHTLSTLVPALAVAKGATVIEKHFKLWNDIYNFKTPDSGHSLEPYDFKTMIGNIKEAEIHSIQRPEHLIEEEGNLRKAQRSQFDGLRPLMDGEPIR